LLGAWNVVCPNFKALDEVRFVPTAQRYEPGVLNMSGVYGMKAAVDFFLGLGATKMADRLLESRGYLLDQIVPLGFLPLGARGGPAASGITTFRHATASSSALYSALEKAGVVAAVRHDREGREHLRFSPHIYNTEAEIDTAVAVLRDA